MNQEPLEDYIKNHIDEEPERLAKLYRDTWLHRLYPRMCTDHYQGRVLKMLTEMIGPLRILELGTFSGYSTLCMAEGMPTGAIIDTIEIDDEHADELRDLFAETAPDRRIRLHIGDAEKVIGELEGSWDLIYIDANKRNYPTYLKLATERLADGGYIIADNTLWSGRVADESDHDPQLEGVREFNDTVRDDPQYECVILPIRDGLSLIRKKPLKGDIRVEWDKRRGE